MTADTDSRGGARQTPPALSRREAEPQVGVVSLHERRFVEVREQHREQIPHERSACTTLTEAVVHPPTIPPRLNQTDGAKAAQMPRDLVLRHAKRIHKLADAELLPAQ